MKVLSISTDRNVLRKQSEVQTRQIAYGSLVDELHIILFTHQGHTVPTEVVQLSDHVWVYPTNVRHRFGYMSKAIHLGISIIRTRAFGAGDLITTQDPFETGYVGARLARKFNLPLQLQVHTDLCSAYFTHSTFLNWLRTKIARRVFRYATTIRVVSRRVRNSIEREYRPAAPISILPIYVERADYQTDDQVINLKEQYPQFDIHVLANSRLESEKNIELAIDGIAQTKVADKNIGLLIAGSGSDQTKLQTYAKQKQVADRVVFLGWSDARGSLYKTADIFVNTSYYEGYARTLVEAALAGSPIISTPVGIVGEVFTGPSVLVCNMHDSACVARGIEHLVKNSTARIEHIQFASEVVERHGCDSWAAYLAAYRSLWDETVAT